MHEIGQGPVPTSEVDRETFRSLRLAEPNERARITLDERMLSIEGRRHASIDLRVNAIQSMKHQSTNLVPAWMLILGFTMMWIGYGLLVPTLYRIVFFGGGACIVLARWLTKQPTLTIQSLSGDTHVVYGNERTLNRLSLMFHHLANNKTLAESRRILETIEAELRNNRDGAGRHQTPELPVVIHSPAPVEALLTAYGEAVEPGVLHAEETEPDWMPTFDPEPVAPSPTTGYLPSYLGTSAVAVAHTYPADHRPSPVTHPVLIPAMAPPMHQGSSTDGAPVFVPSFFGATEVHIPHLQQPSEEEQQEAPIALEAELIEDAMERSEPAPPLQPAQPSPQRSTLLQPKERPTIADTSFRPRTLRALKPRPERRGNFIRRLQETSRDLLHMAVGPSRPSPYATSETTGSLREQAEANVPPASEVLSSLSVENGGAFDASETARLKARGEALLAEAASIEREDSTALESFSFQDLQPSRSREDSVHVPRLDED